MRGGTAHAPGVQPPSKGSLLRPATSPNSPAGGLWTIGADPGFGSTGSWQTSPTATQKGAATFRPGTSPAWSGSESQKRAHVQSLAQLSREELAERLFVERQVTTRLKDQLVRRYGRTTRRMWLSEPRWNCALKPRRTATRAAECPDGLCGATMQLGQEPARRSRLVERLTVLRLDRLMHLRAAAEAGGCGQSQA